MKIYEGKDMDMGGGSRVSKLEDALRGKCVKSPSGLASAIGRKKLGKDKFQNLAAKGLSRHYKGNK